MKKSFLIVVALSMLSSCQNPSWNRQYIVLAAKDLKAGHRIEKTDVGMIMTARLFAKHFPADALHDGFASSRTHLETRCCQRFPNSAVRIAVNMNLGELGDGELSEPSPILAAGGLAFELPKLPLCGCPGLRLYFAKGL